jgi:hypothetical protein
MSTIVIVTLIFHYNKPTGLIYNESEDIANDFVFNLEGPQIALCC